MDNNIILRNQNGFRWFREENIWCKGFIYDLKERLYTGKELAGYFSGIDTFSDFEERVNYANGCFSIIYKRGHELFAACDSIRSFPLFYRKSSNGYVLSDVAYELLGINGGDKLNDIASKEFLATGYVTGNETLIEGLFQIQAGEIISFNEKELKRKFYYTYRTPTANDAEYQELRNAGVTIFDNAFKRFIAGLRGRTVIVPLSGGYDSRLIAVMLKKYEYENVICLTYGRRESPEIEVSKKVAEILGFRWIYVEYSKELISGFLDDEVFKKYYPYAANLVSMFFMQEYFAVKYLHDNKLIPTDSIFAPGHSGDFLGGSQLFKHGNLNIFENIWDITNRIYQVKYCNVRTKPADRDQILHRIQRTIEEKFTGNADLSYSIHEDWDFKEKLAKFNFNSLTTYTYFGYEFRFPFWDREIINFFKILPLQAKINKYLYDDILCEDFFEPFGLNFRKELQPSESMLKRQRMKNRIKYILPEFILRFFLRRHDDIFYKEITQLMVNDLLKEGKKIQTHGNTFNSLIIQWYLEKVRGIAGTGG